jgi:hypothetical protein
MEIKLTRGTVAIIDDADVSLVANYNWHAELDHGVWYARTKPLYRDDRKRSPIGMHHLILGKNPGAHVDHIDGDGLNNRRNNLRAASASQNAMNQRRLKANNTTGFKGVTRRRENKWHAQIQYQGRKIHIGDFPTPRLAADAYDKAAIELFGEFAATNAMIVRSLMSSKNTDNQPEVK